MRVEERRRLALQPAQHRLGVFQKVQRHALAQHHLHGAHGVPGGDGVMQRLADHAVGFIPGCGPQMQGGQCVTVVIAFTQSLSQHRPEQRVVPIPPAFVVQRHDKQVGQRQLTQACLTHRPLHHRIAQRRAHAVQDGGAQQKGLNVGGLALQDLFQQIVLHQPMAAGEGLDERLGITAPRQRHRGHVQASGPAFGARIERLNLRLGQAERHRLVQKHVAFVSLEAQIVRPELKHLALGAQPRQCEARHVSRSDHQVQWRGQVVEQKRQQRIDRRAGGPLVIVEHQDQLAAPQDQPVDQMHQHRLGRESRPGLGQRQNVVTQLGADRPQACCQVRHELVGIAIPGV